MIKNILLKIDYYIDKMWRKTCATIFYYFDNKLEREDIDWIDMHNNMVEDKKKNE